MKKFLKGFSSLILSVFTALCACAGLSACSSNGAGTVSNGAYGGAAGKWGKYEGVKLAFMDGEAYNDGDIDESKVTPELNCLSGKKYYMVADFGIEAPYDNDGRESVTAVVRIQPADTVKASIQDTNTGSVNEETADGVTTISATYKIPEKANSVRNMRLVIQLTANKSGLASVDLSFESSGEIQGVKTSKIEKSAVMGYTEELRFGGAAIIDGISGWSQYVNGVSDDTVEKIVIPNYYGGRYVGGVGERAFDGCGAIKSLTIPNGITTINDYAFKDCSGLSGLIIPDSVTKIGEGAFYGCCNLGEIVLPDGLESVGKRMFFNCSGLSSFIVGDGVTNIGGYAFSGCSGLNSVVIPDSVTNIDGNAFSKCGALTSVKIGGGVKNIGSEAFKECVMLTDVIYNGTVEQWQGLWKGLDWNQGTGEYEIHCIDGDLSKAES